MNHYPFPSRSQGLSSWLDALLDLLYPPHCVVCGQGGAWLCEACLATAPLFEAKDARRAGSGGGSGYTVYSVGPHVLPLRRAVHALKYDGVRVLSEPLGELLAAAWHDRGISVDLVMPVPLHRRRLHQRGYNQSLLLAREVAQHMDLPLCDKGLVRTRHTRSQVGLSRQDRWANVRDAFCVVSGEPVGARVLLVDDVMTTGATLRACSLALRKGGVKQVVCLTLTRVVYDM